MGEPSGSLVSRFRSHLSDSTAVALPCAELSQKAECLEPAFVSAAERSSGSSGGAESKERLSEFSMQLPERVAIVIGRPLSALLRVLCWRRVDPGACPLSAGREADGASEEIIAAADKRVYLPLHGWSESLNLSVASALCLARLFALAPDARGRMDERKRHDLREKWCFVLWLPALLTGLFLCCRYKQLARTPAQEQLYAAWLAARFASIGPSFQRSFSLFTSRCLCVLCAQPCRPRASLRRRATR